MRFKFNITRALKHNITLIFVLLSLTIVSRLFLIMNAPFIYHFDSYMYISKAIDFSSRGEIQFSVGTPFVVSLGVLLYILGSPFGAIIVSRLLVLLMSALIVCVIYLLGLRMSGKTFAFIAALLAISEPFFLSFSIVPHNDIFVVATGLAAFYLATLKSMKFSLVLSPILFYITAFTRPEFFVVLVFPILVYYSWKHLKVISIRNMIKLGFLSSLLVIPAIWVGTVYPTVTRFGITEKFALFLKPELLKLTMESLFEFYNHEFLNQIFFALLGIGVGWALLNTLFKLVVFEKRGRKFSIRRKKDQSIREVFLSDRVMISFCLFLLFLVHIIILTVYGYNYVIVNGEIIIRTWLPDRYLILSRLLLSYPLAYVLTMIVKGVHAEVARKK